MVSGKAGFVLFNSRRSQAAMEFLMTYGWAILVVLGSIAALAYFGVISPAKFLPETCTLPSTTGFACVDFSISSISASLYLVNGGGRDSMINNITVGDCAAVFSRALPDGSSGLFVLNGCSYPVGEKVKLDSVVSYSELSSPFTKSAQGKILSRII